MPLMEIIPIIFFFGALYFVYRALLALYEYREAVELEKELEEEYQAYQFQSAYRHALNQMLSDLDAKNEDDKLIH